MNMNKETKPNKMIVYDYNNLTTQNTANDNCFTCEAEPCVCDCDCDGDPWPDYDPSHEIWQDN